MANGLKMIADSIAEAEKKANELATEFEKRARAADKTINGTKCSFRNLNGMLLVDLHRGTDGQDGISVTAADFANICNWFRKHYGDVADTGSDAKG